MAHISSLGAGIYSNLAFNFDNANPTPPSVAETFYKSQFANSVALNTGASALLGGEYRIVDNVREFPQMGTPPNIVNVPVYGSKVSRQVQGQADAPTFEVTLNYIPSDWRVDANYLGNYVGNGVGYSWRFALMNAAPSNYNSTDTMTATFTGTSTTSSALLTVATMTVSATNRLQVGMSVTGASPAAVIIAQVTSTEADGSYGGKGTYTLSVNQTTGGAISGATYAGANLATGSIANSQYFWVGKMEALQISPQLTDANQATLTVSIQSDFVGPFTTN